MSYQGTCVVCVPEQQMPSLLEYGSYIFTCGNLPAGAFRALSFHTIQASCGLNRPSGPVLRPAEALERPKHLQRTAQSAGMKQLVLSNLLADALTQAR